MKILNFVPLLIWMLGFLALGILETHLSGTNNNIKDSLPFSKMWLIGTICWLTVGIALSAIGA